MNFAERYGHRPKREVLQVDGIDTPLRNLIWSAFCEVLPDAPQNRFALGWALQLYRAFWRDFLQQPVDAVPAEDWKCRREMKAVFFDLQWYDVYSFVEFIIALNPAGCGDSFRADVNRALEREMSGYRAIDSVIVPITDREELSAVEDALAATDKNVLRPARQHITDALAKLSDRDAPDYRNSIKESISAVESIAALLTGREKAELGPALKELEMRMSLHGALRSGFLSLYGWTSDANGIRHALLDEPNVDFADAKFMLVACAAFVHYLVQKAGAHGLPADST